MKKDSGLYISFFVTIQTQRQYAQHVGCCCCQREVKWQRWTLAI